MANWEFEERDPRYIEQDPTQRDQFNNDDVTLADAIVRETIQNSSDAGDSGAPVKVRFQIRVIAADQQEKFRQLFSSLRPHLAACGIDPATIDRPNPRVLIIEDFETKGLTGDPGALDGGNFHSFWRRLGKSGKTGRLLGRWGLGKLVYSSSSDIRCFFGLTVRAGNSTPLLMGQAVLSNHDINSKRYVAHAFWFGDRNADRMQMPITDATQIVELSAMWGIRRTSQPGLSIAVPYLNANIDEQLLMRGVLENYYFPILAGRLSVEVGSRVVNADNFLTIANEVLANSMAGAQRFGFVAQVSSTLAKKPAFQARLLPGAQKFSPEIFDADDVTKMKEVFGRGDLLHVRLCLQTGSLISCLQSLTGGNSWQV